MKQKQISLVQPSGLSVVMFIFYLPSVRKV